MTAHGLHAYKNLGCRCHACRAAETAYRRQNQAEHAALVAKLGGLPPHVPHGLNAYDNWGCRCDVCRAAKRDYQRQLRARKDLDARGLPQIPDMKTNEGACM